jgi:hypothetical protein
MSDNAKLDDELAAFTDNVLAGRDIPVSKELEGLSHVVSQLHRVIAPDAPPSPAFRDRLTQRLIREWNLLHDRQPRRVPFYRRRSILALAASLLVVVLAVVLLSLGAGDDNAPLQGTALGSGEWTVFIFMGILITAGLLAVWFRQHTKQ